jgi:hypothetical protein
MAADGPVRFRNPSLNLCSRCVPMQLMRTRGELLAHAISFPLNNAVKVVRGLRKGLTSEERY